MSTALANEPAGGAAAPAGRTRPKRHLGRWVAVALGVLALLVMVLGTKVVPDGDLPTAVASKKFDKTTFGAEQFPKVKDAITKKAVEAPTLAGAIAADPQSAAKQYGLEVAGNPVYSTTFTGTVSECTNGLCTVQIEGMPPDVTVRIQTGPAINGTDLRDAAGLYDFGQFTNQIEYQDAGAALNDEMKKKVLDPIDVQSLTGKTVEVTGAFTAINPQGWLVTPVSLAVQ